MELTTGIANAILFFVDGELVGADDDHSHTGSHGATRLDARGNFSFPFSATAGEHRLDLLSVSMGMNNWLGVEDNWKGLLAPNGKLRFVENATGAVQDITHSGWLMQPKLQGERLGLPGGGAAPRPWEAQSGEVKPLTWLQSEFVTPAGTTALILDAGGLGRGHAYVNGFDIGRFYLITGTPCSACGCGGDSCCNKALCGKPSQRLYHIPPDALKPLGGKNLLTLFEELGAKDLSAVQVRRFTSADVPQAVVHA